jgi:two-component system sensor histidine kinase VicK
MTTPASLLFALSQHDHRICFAYNLSNKQFIYANPAFENFFQVEASNASMKKLFSMVCPDDKNYLKQAYATLQPGVFKADIEFKMNLSNKKYYFLRLNLLLQTNEDEGKILTGYMENISDSKAHHQQLHELANHKKAVLNTISHDLTAPLGSIQNLAALTARKTKSIEDQEVKKWILLIEEISKKTVHLIQTFVKKEFTEIAGLHLDKKKTPAR